MTKIGLVVEGKQSLTMTQNLQQNLKILQMPLQEVEQLVKDELMLNPFLTDEIVDDEPEAEEPAAEEERRSDGFSSDEYWSSTPSYTASDDYDPFANIVKYPSLQQHIIDQIEASFTDNKEKLVAYKLLEYLTEAGYLDPNYLELEESLKSSPGYLETIVQEMQKFSPGGIFARNLSECMRLQLVDLGLISPQMELILQNLELVATQNWKKLAKILNFSIEETLLLVSYCKTLNPKPGLLFTHDYAPPIVPELFLRLSPNNDIIIESNDRYLGRIQLNKEYYLTSKNSVTSKEDKKFCSEHFATASNLLIAIAQRKKTLFRVAYTIAEKQMNFFQYGVMHLKPMTLSDIAEVLELNESTISRAVNGKYVATVFGILELKFFFSSKLSSKSNNDSVSSTKVKELIKSLVLAETINDILSDEQIAKSLTSAFNVNIARRTVTKYREALSIPSSAMRKRLLAR